MYLDRSKHCQMFATHDEVLAHLKLTLLLYHYIIRVSRGTSPCLFIFGLLLKYGIIPFHRHNSKDEKDKKQDNTYQR